MMAVALDYILFLTPYSLIPGAQGVSRKASCRQEAQTVIIFQDR
jgi:hypothetical protein